MSGVLPNLTDHIAMGVFDAFQIPYSALEREHEVSIHDAASAGAGTIVRGGVARGIPVSAPAALERLPERFRQTYAKRRDLWDEAELDAVLDGLPRMEFMLNASPISHPQMTTTIVGTWPSRATWPTTWRKGGEEGTAARRDQMASKPSCRLDAASTPRRTRSRA